MTEHQAGPPPAPSRIVILLDASRSSMAALEAAAELAARRHAELLALFIEEEALLRCAGYPWTREIGLSGAVRAIEADAVEQSMRARAEKARQALLHAAQRRGVTARLKVSRGGVVHEALAVLTPDDLLVLGKVGYARSRGLRFGSTARAIIQQAPGPVMVCEEPGSGARPRGVAVVVEPGEQGVRTLETAAALLGGDEAITTALPDGPPHAATADETPQGWLRSRYPAARWLERPASDPAHVARALAEAGAEKLIVSRRSALLTQTGPRALVEAVQLPVLVVP